MDEFEEPKKPAGITLGEDLSAFSIEELTARISACESEIDRLRTALDEKRRSQSAAENFFRS